MGVLGIAVALLATGALAGCMSDTGSGNPSGAGDGDSGTDEATVTKYLYQDQSDNAHVQTLLHKEFPNDHPEAAAFLKNFQYPGEDENDLMLIVANSDEDNIEQKVALDYLANHPDMIEGWLEGTGYESRPGEGQTLVIGAPNGWVGEVIRSYMVKKILEDEFGYTIEMPFLDAGVIYQGLATRDVDIFVGAWLPLQIAHLNKVENDVMVHADNLPPESVTISLAVPKYLYDQGITSLEDLDENKELFDGKIHGIEPGAGMMITGKERLEQWDVYGLGDWEILDSSTPAMLAAYDAAVQDNEPIVIMMWRPHYAYAKWSGEDAVMDLEDPGYPVPESRVE